MRLLHRRGKGMGCGGCDAVTGAVMLGNMACLKFAVTAFVSASPATSTCLTTGETRASDMTEGTAARKVSCSIPLLSSVSKALLSSRSTHFAPSTCANATHERGGEVGHQGAA